MTKVSIIIPTANRANQLAFTLDSINKLAEIGDAEIIVIDNGSVDNTAQVCEDYKPKLRNFIYQYDSMPGLLTGRHKGAQLANSDILCFLDDDVELSRNWLCGVIKAFEKNPLINFVTGPSLPKYHCTPPGWLKYFWERTPFGGKMCTWLSLLDLEVEQRLVPAEYVWGLNFCIRKNALFDLGGFHPDCMPGQLQQFQGDGETGLSYKANVGGHKALYSSEVQLYHVVPSERLTISYFEKRAFYQGVCDSYTDLRSRYLLGLKDQVAGPPKKQRSKPTLQRFITSVIRRVKTGSSNSVPDEVRMMKKKLDEKSKEGYTFHQDAFRNRAEIQAWVLKDDYWDYALPGIKAGIQ